jgi:hypothetical protein
MGTVFDLRRQSANGEIPAAFPRPAAGEWRFQESIATPVAAALPDVAR